MFYCTTCAERNGWPETGFKSRGRCEICEKPAECNERQSKLLPMPYLRDKNDNLVLDGDGQPRRKAEIPLKAIYDGLRAKRED